jgi:CRP-like cAMP-binding protein
MSQRFAGLLAARVARFPGGRQPEQPPRRMRRRDAVALAGVPLFQGFSARHLRELAERTDEVAYRPGEHVVAEGRLGETLFVVLEGEAQVVRGGRRVAKLVPGDFFGELSAIDGGPRTATVVADTPLVALRLFRRTLMGMLQREPVLAVKLLEGIARRIRDLTHPLEA